jgi:hypothetical protein
MVVLERQKMNNPDIGAHSAVFEKTGGAAITNTLPFFPGRVFVTLLSIQMDICSYQSKSAE